MGDSVSQEINLLLETIVKKDITNFIVTVTNNIKGVGNLGDTIFISLKEKDGDKHLNLVAKQAFPDGAMRRNYPIKEVFFTEIYFYEKVWKRFEKFWRKYQADKVIDIIPKCLGSNTKEFSEVLVLENLKFKSFEMVSKRKTFDKDHLELLFRIYGRFHATAFAFRVLDTRGYLEISKGLEDTSYDIKSYQYFPDLIKIAQEISLESLLPDDKVLKKYKKYVENGVDIFIANLIYDGDYSAILHGDCWSNNMLFKYESGKVVDVRLIDFQFARVGTPVYDLSYCLYSGAGKEIYNNLDYYLKVYHDSLSNTLKDFGCDGKRLYPFVALKEDWKKYSIFGFTMALLVWKGRLTYDENVVDLTDFQNGEDEIAEGFMAAKYDEEEFKKKIRDLVLHMYDNDFL